MISPEAFARVQAGFELRRLEFIETELRVGTTFVQVAQTSANAGKSESATRNLEHSREALKQARKIFAGIQTMERVESDRFADAFSELEKSISKVTLKIYNLVLSII